MKLREDVVRQACNVPLDEIRPSICSAAEVPHDQWQALRGISGTKKMSMTPRAKTRITSVPHNVDWSPVPHF